MRIPGSGDRSVLQLLPGSALSILKRVVARLADLSRRVASGRVRGSFGVSDVSLSSKLESMVRIVSEQTTHGDQMMIEGLRIGFLLCLNTIKQ